MVSADIGLRADRIGGLRMEAETMHFGSQALEVRQHFFFINLGLVSDVVIQDGQIKNPRMMISNT